MAILQQSYGRFGGAERLAFSHYVQLKRMNKDVTLFYEGRVSPGWKKRLQGEPIQSIPSGVASNPRGLKHLMEFLRKLNDYDRIIIHHHVEPILAFYLSKLLGPKIIWYSGSVFELPWEKTITGEDYRRISTTVKRTGSEFYGSLFSKLLLSDPLYGLTVQLAKFVDIKTARGFGKIIGNSLFLSNFLARTYGLKEVPPVAYPGPDPLLEKLSSAPPVKEQDYMLAVGTLIPLKNIEGPPEVVMEGVTGYVVNPRDHQYIGAKMNALLADDSLRREMGQRARENIARKFTLEKSTRSLLDE